MENKESYTPEEVARMINYFREYDSRVADRVTAIATTIGRIDESDLKSRSRIIDTLAQRCEEEIPQNVQNCLE